MIHTTQTQTHSHIHSIGTQLGISENDRLIYKQGNVICNKTLLIKDLNVLTYIGVIVQKKIKILLFLEIVSQCSYVENLLLFLFLDSCDP